MSNNILLLGPGKDRYRIGKPDFGTDPNEDLWVVERSERFASDWKDARYFVGDLNHDHKRPYFLPNTFDEIHAYEVLNLLPGNESSFFHFWEWVWIILKPGGKVIAKVPYWGSKYIHTYPGPQRVYTKELVQYLDHSVTLHNEEDFVGTWPHCYNFQLAEWRDVNHTGSVFTLVKA